jgi:rhamnosyltransferase
VKASIVIRTLNEARYLDHALTAVRQQHYPADQIEIIVVDSGSTDPSLTIAAKHHCQIVHIRREDFSFGRSLNVGCEVATGQALVFISGHCVPTDSEWLTNLIKPFADEKVAVTYGRQIGGPETKFSEHCLFEKYFPSSGSGDHQAPFFCNNANSAFRRSSWEKSRFDETLTGLEDIHLAKRLHEAGELTVYVPNAAVYHYHHERWRQVKRRYEREAIALQKIMPEFHVHFSDFVRYFIAGVYGDAQRALSQGGLFRKLPEIVAFRFCQYYGVWKGNHQHRQLSRREKEKYFYPN